MERREKMRKRRKGKRGATWKEEREKQLEVLRVVSSASSPQPVKELTEGRNLAQGSGVNMFDTPTLIQPVAETSCCPHTLPLISYSHTCWQNKTLQHAPGLRRGKKLEEDNGGSRKRWKEMGKKMKD